MRRWISVAIVILIVASACGAGVCLLTPQERDRETLYQVSTLEALMKGEYDGIRDIGDLKRHGDTGLGTFDALDGEMIFFEGTCYQITSDGQVHVVADSEGTPFACVTFMDQDIRIEIDTPMNLTELSGYLCKRFPSNDTFYVIQIEGHFQEVLTRSVPRQDKPYPPLPDVIKNQTTFTYQDIDGTIVGVWSPSYVGGINAAGFHFHFISQDRTMGGHLLDCQIGNVVAVLDETPELLLEMA